MDGLDEFLSMDAAGQQARLRQMREETRSRLDQLAQQKQRALELMYVAKGKKGHHPSRSVRRHVGHFFRNRREAVTAFSEKID